MPHPMQKPIGRLGIIAVVLPSRGLVTLSATNSRFVVRIASMNAPWIGVRSGASVSVGTVTFLTVGFKLQSACNNSTRLQGRI